VLIIGKARDLIVAFLLRDPSLRLTIREALVHPWIKDDEKDLESLYRTMITGIEKA